jgi:hypothetical protein
VQDEVDEMLVLVLADPLDEAVGGELLAELVRRQAVLGEAEVEEGCDGDVAGRSTDLLLLLVEVGAANEADGTFLAERRQEGEDLGRRVLDAVRLVSRFGGSCEPGGGVLTRRAGVRVPSTSNRQIVSLSGRSPSGG